MKLRSVLTDPPTKMHSIRLTRVSTKYTFDGLYCYGTDSKQWYEVPTLRVIQLDRPEDLVWSFGKPRPFDLEQYERLIIGPTRCELRYVLETSYGVTPSSTLPPAGTFTPKKCKAHGLSFCMCEQGTPIQDATIFCSICQRMACGLDHSRKTTMNPKVEVNAVLAGISLEELGFNRPFVFASNYNSGQRETIGVFVSKGNTATNPNNIDCMKLFDCFQVCQFDKTARVYSVAIDIIKITVKS